jgi:outer membrane protein assembly factor BamB
MINAKWMRATLCLGLTTAAWMANAAEVGEWPFSRTNSAMTGVSTVELRTPLTLAWQYKLMEKPKGQSEMLVSSAVVRAGKAYAGCKDGKFVCLELETGKKIWEATAKGAFDGAAGFSGPLVIAGCQDGFVYAWNADTGKEVWKYETMAEIHAATNIWTDPTTKKDKVIIGSYDYSVYSLDAETGKKGVVGRDRILHQRRLRSGRWQGGLRRL